jgi:hypothetical protein
MTRASMSRRARRPQQQRSMSESNQLPARATVVDPELLTRYVEREDGLPEVQVIVPGDAEQKRATQQCRERSARIARVFQCCVIRTAVCAH